MSRCAVCGLPGARGFKTHGGVEYGPSHEGKCHELKWAAHFLEVTGAGSWEMDLVRWEWRQQRALAHGRPFTEPAPKSPGEKDSAHAITMADLDDVAKEVA